jgi:hypothetical protein
MLQIERPTRLRWDDSLMAALRRYQSREVRVAGISARKSVIYFLNCSSLILHSEALVAMTTASGRDSLMRTLNRNCAGTLLSSTTPSTLVVLGLIIGSLWDHASILYLPHPCYLLPHNIDSNTPWVGILRISRCLFSFLF